MLVAPYVQMIQLDIMDGIFVKPRTWPYYANDYSFDALLKEEQGLPLWDKVDYEVDLMVQKPETLLMIGLQLAPSVYCSLESTKDMDAVVKEFRQRFAYTTNPEERDVEFILAKVLKPN
jgi:pentose-5-phosphate-3-epimerase